ncbi:MAG: CPBP family intramembrane metalloprotease [Alphaproteobacteria bacterium]|nr:CPBP family intramembrane metalloprotease [Alphaproteobacteria bacterium]
MKKLALMLIAFVREDFDWVVYLGTALLIGGLMVANYQYDAFDALTRTTHDPLQMFSFAVFYGVPWLSVVLLQAARGRLQSDGDPIDRDFVRMALMALFVVSFVDWFPYHLDLVDQAPPPARSWVRGMLWNMKSTLCWFTPMAIWWVVFDRPRGVARLYGFTTKGFDVKPYLMCLSVIAPLVAWASFQPAFLRTYPTYKPWTGVEEYLGVHPLVTVLPYELVYGFDFSFVEMFFRGFLVIGMAKWLGRNAVLPMVAMYAVLHFGKPVPETIGSVIGGYILGVFALRSKSILGGIMLHLGMAWSMEAAAFAQHVLNGR